MSEQSRSNGNGQKWGQASFFRYLCFAAIDQIFFQLHEFLSKPILLSHVPFPLRDPLAHRNTIPPKIIGNTAQRIARKPPAKVTHNTASRRSYPIPAHTP